MRASCVLMLLAGVMCALAVADAGAQAPYPAQTVRMVLPFAPGGPNDQLARPLAQKLTEALGQPFIIDNKPGANTLIGAGFVANAPPDGHTMMFSTNAHTANPSIVARMPFDALRDFTPITQMVRTYGTLLLVRPEFPARDVRDLVALARQHPGRYTFGHGGIGNATHVAVELFRTAAAIDILSVPYKGTGETLPALLGGQIHMIGASTVVGAPYLASGQMRALGITGETRSPLLPDVPTFVEQGYPDVVLLSFYGLWFPAGAARERVDLMQRTVKAALESPDMTRVMADSGVQLVASTPDEFAAFLARDVELQAGISRRIGLTPK